MKNIVFFGDSFAAHGHNATADAQCNTANTNLISYIDLVADDQQATAIHMGFGGQSWWYSYTKLQEWIRNNSVQWQATDAVIMCLTDAARPRVSTHDNWIALHKSTSLRQYHAVLQSFTEEFDQWAYRHFLNEVARLFKNKKVIMLPCFTGMTWISVEMRRIFATSAVALCTISHSEFQVSDKMKNFQNVVNHSHHQPDLRANHLSLHNNRALAQDIIDKLNNYTPGIFMLNLPTYAQGNGFFQHEFDAADLLFQKYTVNKLDS